MKRRKEGERVIISTVLCSGHTQFTVCVVRMFQAGSALRDMGGLGAIIIWIR